VTEKKTDSGDTYEQSGNFGIGSMNGGEIKDGAKAAGVINEAPSNKAEMNPSIVNQINVIVPSSEKNGCIPQSGSAKLTIERDCRETPKGQSMLDVAALAKMVTSLLAPAIPFLIKGGEQAWVEASKNIGADTWTRAKNIWMKLVSCSESKPNGEETTQEIIKAATDVANNPSDGDAQAALRFQIKKLLTDAPELSLEIAKALDEAKASSAQTSIRVGGVYISGKSTVTNSGNIVGGNQLIGN
jgi:hypothetical protein